MALLQRTKKLFGPLLDDLDYVIARKEAMELQVESYMRWRFFKHEGGRQDGSRYHHTGTFNQGKDILKAKRASLAAETFEMLRFMRGNKYNVTNFFKSLFNAFISFLVLTVVIN